MDCAQTVSNEARIIEQDVLAISCSSPELSAVGRELVARFHEEVVSFASAVRFRDERPPVFYKPGFEIPCEVEVDDDDASPMREDVQLAYQQLAGVTSDVNDLIKSVLVEMGGVKLPSDVEEMAGYEDYDSACIAAMSHVMQFSKLIESLMARAEE